MSIYKRPGSKYYWTKFELNGKRIHKSTKTTNPTKALQWEAALSLVQPHLEHRRDSTQPELS